MKNLYIVRKLVYAKSAKDAIEKEKDEPVTDVYLDEEWRLDQLEKNNIKGFEQCQYTK